jgi:hypothetical protein
LQDVLAEHARMAWVLNTSSNTSVLDLMCCRRCCCCCCRLRNHPQAFIMAGLKYKLGSRPEDMQRIMQNTCLINAILKQHIIPGTCTAQHCSAFGTWLQYSRQSLAFG